MYSQTFCPLHTPATDVSTSATSVSSTSSPLPCQQASDETAVLRASTYALWEQLYSTSATSLSVERLMYLRATTHSTDMTAENSDKSDKNTKLPSVTSSMVDNHFSSASAEIVLQQASSSSLWVTALFHASSPAVFEKLTPTPAPLPSSTAVNDANLASLQVKRAHLTPQHATPAKEQETTPDVVQSQAPPKEAVGSGGPPEGLSCVSGIAAPSEVRGTVQDDLEAHAEVLQCVSAAFPSMPLSLTDYANTCAPSATKANNAFFTEEVPAENALERSRKYDRVNSADGDEDDSRGSVVAPGGCGSMVLQPQVCDRRRRAAAATAPTLTPGPMPSLSDRALPASTCGVGSPLLPPLPSRHGQAGQQQLFAITLGSASVTLMGESALDSSEVVEIEGKAQQTSLPGSLTSVTQKNAGNAKEENEHSYTMREEVDMCGTQNEEDQQPAVRKMPNCTLQENSDSLSKEDEESLQTPQLPMSMLARAPLFAEALERAQSVQETDEEAEVYAASDNHSHQVEGVDDDEDICSVSLRTTPLATTGATNYGTTPRPTDALPPPPAAAALSTATVVCLTDTVTATSRDYVFAPLQVTAVAPVSPSSNSAFPLTDSEGLVFSPPRRRLMQLYPQRRRLREPIESNASSRSLSPPPSPGMRPFFSPSRSVSTTPVSLQRDFDHEDTLNAEEEPVMCDDAGVSPEAEAHENNAATEVVGESAFKLCASRIPSLSPLSARAVTPPSPPVSTVEELEAVELSPACVADAGEFQLPVEPHSGLLPIVLPSYPVGQRRFIRVQASVRSKTTADETPERTVQEEDVRVVDSGEEKEDCGALATVETEQPSKEVTLSVDIRLSDQRSVKSYSSSCGGGDIRSSTPADVRHTAAALPTNMGVIESRAATVDHEDIHDNADTEAVHMYPSKVSTSPAPRRISAFSPVLSSTPSPDDVRARRSISTMDFTWAEEADDLLRRQQQRQLYSQSIGKGGHSSSFPSTNKTNLLDEHQISQIGLLGPRTYHSLCDGAIGRRPLSMSREGVAYKEMSRSSAWSVSPLPQDPHARFRTTNTYASRHVAGSRAHVAAVTLPTSSAGVGVASNEFPSPMRVVPSSSPQLPTQLQRQRRIALSSSPVSPSPYEGQEKAVFSGTKRSRDVRVIDATTTTDRGNRVGEKSRGTLQQSFDGVMTTEDASLSALPQRKMRANACEEIMTSTTDDAPRKRRTRRERRVGSPTDRVHDTMRNNNLHGRAKFKMNQVRGGEATLLRCRARLNSSFTSALSPATAATAAAVVNEFALPRTTSVEPVLSASTASRAASPLQPRPVNMNHSNNSNSQRKLQAEKADMAEEKSSVNGGNRENRSVKSAIARRKSSIVASSQKHNESKRLGKGN